MEHKGELSEWTARNKNVSIIKYNIIIQYHTYSTTIIIIIVYREWSTLWKKRDGRKKKKKKKGQKKNSIILYDLRHVAVLIRMMKISFRMQSTNSRERQQCLPVWRGSSGSSGLSSLRCFGSLAGRVRVRRRKKRNKKKTNVLWPITNGSDLLERKCERPSVNCMIIAVRTLCFRRQILK